MVRHIGRTAVRYQTQYLAEIGGAMRDRTADLLRAKQALSQLSYSPETKTCWLIFARQGGKVRSVLTVRERFTNAVSRKFGRTGQI